MAGKDVGYGQEPAAAGGRPGNSSILELASFLLQAANIVGEINVHTSLNAAVTQTVKQSSQGIPISEDQITPLVFALDHDKPRICSRLGVSALVLVFAVLRVSVHCWSKDRGLYLLIEALREDPNSRQSPHKSTSALDDTSSISRKARVGQKIISVALKQFCKGQAPRTTRVLTGLLTVELLKDCKHTVHILLSEPEERRHMIGQIFMNESHSFLGYVAGLIIRQLARQSASWQNFCPKGNGTRKERKLFENQVQDSQWLGCFKEYVGGLQFEAGNTSREFMSFAYRVALGTETSYSSASRHWPQVLVTVQGKLSISVTGYQIQDARENIPLYMDVPLESITELDVVENLGTDPGSELCTSGFEVKITLSERPGLSVRINAKVHEYPFLSIGFVHKEGAEELKRMIDTQMQGFRISPRSPATPLSHQGGGSMNTESRGSKGHVTKNKNPVMLETLVNIPTGRTHMGDLIDSVGTNLQASRQFVAVTLHEERVFDEGEPLCNGLLRRDTQPPDAGSYFVSEPGPRNRMGSVSEGVNTKARLAEGLMAVEHVECASRRTHISIAGPIDASGIAEVQDEKSDDKTRLSPEDQSDIEDDLTSSAGWINGINTIETAPEFRDPSPDVPRMDHSPPNSHKALSSPKEAQTVHAKIDMEVKPTVNSALINKGDEEATQIPSSRLKALTVQSKRSGDLQTSRPSKVNQRLLDRHGQRPSTVVSNHLALQSPKVKPLTPVAGSNGSRLVTNEAPLVKKIYKCSNSEKKEVAGPPPKDTLRRDEEDVSVFDIPQSPNRRAEKKGRSNSKTTAKSKGSKTSEKSNRLKPTPSRSKDGLLLNGNQKKALANTKKARRAAKIGCTDDDIVGNGEQQQLKEIHVIPLGRRVSPETKAARSSPIPGPSKKNTKPNLSNNGGLISKKREHTSTPLKHQKIRREAAVIANRRIQGLSGQEDVGFGSEDIEAEIHHVHETPVQDTEKPALSERFEEYSEGMNNINQSPSAQSADFRSPKNRESESTEVNMRTATKMHTKHDLRLVTEDAVPPSVDIIETPQAVKDVDGEAFEQDEMLIEDSASKSSMVDRVSPPHQHMVTHASGPSTIANPREIATEKLWEDSSLLQAQPVSHGLTSKGNQLRQPQVIEISSGIEPSSDNEENIALEAHRKPSVLNNKRKSEVLKEDSIKRVKISTPSPRQKLGGEQGDKSIVTGNRDQRKATIIGFDANGPRNQGVSSAKGSMMTRGVNNKVTHLNALATSSTKRKHRDDQESGKQFISIVKEVESPAEKRRRTIDIVPLTQEDDIETLTRKQTSEAISIPRRTYSQGSRVQDNGSPMTTVGQALKLGAIDAAQLFTRLGLRDEDDPFIIDQTESLNHKAKGKKAWEDNLGEPNLPAHITQRTSGKTATFDSKRSSGNTKLLPSSPTAPSRMLEDLTAHEVAADGNFVNVGTASILKVTAPQDPFMDEAHRLPNRFLAVLRDLGKVPKATSTTTGIPKKLDVKPPFETDRKNTPLKVKDTKHGQRPCLSPIDSSSSRSTESIFPSSPPWDDKTKKDEMLSPAWTDALRPYQRGVLTSLSDMSNKLVRSLMNKEVAIDDAVKDYEIGGNLVLDGLNKAHEEGQREHQRKVQAANKDLLCIFQDVKMKLDQDAKEMKRGRVADIRKEWALEQEHIGNHLRNAMEVFGA